MSSKRKQPEESGHLVGLESRSPSPVVGRLDQAAKRRRPFNFSIESLMQAAREPSPARPDEQEEPASGCGSALCSPAGSLGSPADSLALAEQPGAHSGSSTCSSPSSSLASVRPEVDGCSAGLPGAPSESSSSQSGATAKGATNQLLRPPVCRDARLAPFQCHLDNLDLWHRFHPLDTEMIITKQGRRMFPPVKVTFSLDAAEVASASLSQAGGAQGPSGRDKFQVLMDILPYDGKRYRYAYHKSSWQQAGKADPPSPAKLFLHPDGPFTLDQLKRQVISFEKIKLTNNDANKHGYIVLNSMHKYQPRIHLVLWRGKDSQQNLANAPISQLDGEIYKTFIFSETIFTAVTAYQNHSITKLKIDSNPFAKGFRDSTRITDLELETINDLMSDGQCPFSPPRAPPHGFPHFLFAAAAAQQQQLGGAGPLPGGPLAQQPGQAPGAEDAASALLRERTIMALDSFLQQQQAAANPHRAAPLATPSSSGCNLTGAGTTTATSGPRLQRAPGTQASNHQIKSPHPPPPLLYPGGPPLPPPPYSSAAPTNASSGSAFFGLQPAGPPAGQSLEQLLMQQHQFAAAVAAAAAAHQHQNAYQQQQQQQQYYPQLAPHLQSLFGLAPGAQAPTSAGHLVAARQRSSPSLSNKQSAGSPNEQLSPIGAAKLAELTGASLHAAPPGGATAPNNHYLHPSQLAAGHLQKGSGDR